MVFEYVAVEHPNTPAGQETIIAEGKVTAWSRDKALLKVGATLGKKLTDDVEVSIRPF